MDMQTIEHVLALVGILTAAATAAVPVLRALARLTATRVDDDAVTFLARALDVVSRFGWLRGRPAESKRPSVPPVAIVLLIGLALGACGLIPVVAKILPYITEAGNVVDAIESYADDAFARAPNPALQGKVDIAIARTRAALDTVNAAGRGASELADRDLRATFASFRDAYAALLALVQPLGVRVQPPGALMAVEGDALLVPTPDTLLDIEEG